MPRNIDALKQLAWWLKVSKDRDPESPYPALWRILRRGDGDSEGRDAAIARACEAFGLDPKIQADRNLLLGIFADIHFPRTDGINALASRNIPKKRGAPVKLDWWRQFKRDAVEAVDSLPDNAPRPTHDEIGELMKDRHRERYKNQESDTLGRYLRKILQRGRK